MKDIKACLSHKSDEWLTPYWLYEAIDEIYKVDVDLYANEINFLAPFYYTKENPFDPDKHRCDRVFYANPPYSKCGEACKTAEQIALKGGTVIMLIPARTDTKYFHEIILKNYYEITPIITCFIFIKGRLKFSQAKQGAPFPSMIVIFSHPSRMEWMKRHELERKIKEHQNL